MQSIWQEMIQTILMSYVCICVKLLQSCQTLCNPLTVAHQAPLSMGFSRQEYWSGLPFPSPGDLSSPGIEPSSLCLLLWQGGALPLVQLAVWRMTWLVSGKRIRLAFEFVSVSVLIIYISIDIDVLCNLDMC